MAVTMKHAQEFRVGLARSFFSNSPEAVEFAQRFGLSPDEMRTVIKEAIVHLEGKGLGYGPGVPIAAHPPAALMRLSSQELRALLDQFPAFEQERHS